MTTSEATHLYLIIPAAGQSRRMGKTSNKQVIPVGGIPVLARTLLAFERFTYEKQETGSFRLHCILVTSDDLIANVKTLCLEYRISFVEQIICGGHTRQESVNNGICHLPNLARPPQPKDIVFIHDGARCFVDSDILNRCLDGAKLHGICAAAVPVKDTIKQISLDQHLKVSATLDRSTLYAIQTPQAFEYQLLSESYTRAQEDNRLGTDDTSLAEAIGLDVYLVEGSYNNIKITTPEDLLMAELLEKQSFQ